MNNLGIVTAREYFTRVKKPSFIILTLLMPFFMAGVILVPVLFSMIKDDTKKEVVVLDKTGKYTDLFIQAQLADSTACESYTFLPATEPLEAYRSDSSQVEAVVCITADLTTDNSACKIYSKGEVQQELQRYVENLLSDKIRQDKVAAYNVPGLEDIIEDVQARFSVKTVKWSEDGAESLSSGDIAVALGMLSAMLIYMFVMIYGAMVMQSVMEEKTNRIVEVIIGSVKPFQLMMGKILGVLLVGFTQLLIWGIMLTGLMTAVGFIFGSVADTESLQQTALAAGQMQQPMVAETLENNEYAEIMQMLSGLPLIETVILFVLYFLGGYLLYSSFYAAIGASVNSQEDSSQFMMPMVIIMIIALYGAMGSIENTDGPLAFWASLFPLTSPIVMMVRIPFGVPLWQEILSVVLLYATALGFIWMCGRIYRVGILMYGKKPTYKELMKWIRFK